jgi:hypothetical protein
VLTAFSKALRTISAKASPPGVNQRPHPDEPAIRESHVPDFADVVAQVEAAGPSFCHHDIEFEMVGQRRLGEPSDGFPFFRGFSLNLPKVNDGVRITAACRQPGANSVQ